MRLSRAWARQPSSAYWGTIALQLLIGSYLRVSPDDTGLHANLDYDCTQYAMDALVGRRG